MYLQNENVSTVQHNIYTCMENIIIIARVTQLVGGMLGVLCRSAYITHDNNNETMWCVNY